MAVDQGMVGAMSDALDRLTALADAAQDPGDAVPVPAWALREMLAELKELRERMAEHEDAAREKRFYDN
jgi:hypothetical protein